MSLQPLVEPVSPDYLNDHRQNRDYIRQEDFHDILFSRIMLEAEEVKDGSQAELNPYAPLRAVPYEELPAAERVELD